MNISRDSKLPVYTSQKSIYYILLRPNNLQVNLCMRGPHKILSDGSLGSIIGAPWATMGYTSSNAYHKEIGMVRLGRISWKRWRVAAQSCLEMEVGNPRALMEFRDITYDWIDIH